MKHELDDWDDGPDHPREDDRFTVAYADYPGGEDAYWRDFRVAALAYYRHNRDEFEGKQTAAEFADQQAFYALKRRVFDMSARVAGAAGRTSRDVAHWLVKDKGFPWRDNCDSDDLRRMLDFLDLPATVDEARLAPTYPDWRDRAREASQSRQRD